MSLLTVYQEKELTPSAHSPLILCEFQFIDGSFLYASTAPLNSAEGGFPYNATNYLARVSQQEIAALAARSADGIDRVPSVRLTLADPDKTLYSNYETTPGKGFKGAILVLRLVFWQADTPNFSSDSDIIFVGICDPPSFTQGLDQMKITATADHNMAKAFLPVFHVQQRCGNVFPITAGQRLLGATDMSSMWWGCGYNPDQPGTDPEIGGDCKRGNMNGGAPFTTCNYTKSDCLVRGMYRTDSANRATGRFTGIQFAPLQREIQSKSYLQGKTVTVLQARNDAAYAESFPMLYGTQWLKPIVTVIPADANSTRFECVICQDDIGLDGIVQVVVNGVVVPRNGSSPDNALYRWNFVGDPTLRTNIGGGAGTPPTTSATGSRNGAATKDAQFDEQGDPYGSLATIEVVVYAQIAQAGSLPNVMVLAQGPRLKTPTTPNTADQASWPKVRTNNPAFCILDVLIWSNWRYSDIGLQTFINEAQYCAQQVSYTNLYGGTSSHNAYISEFVLQQRRTAAETVAALLRSCNGQLVRNPSTGLLELLIRKTLADQQPAPIVGSNYSTPVQSQTAAGVAQQGYVAYKIDESVIQRDGLTGPPKITPYMTASSQATNRVVFPFQDADNAYAQDSISNVDADAANRAGGYQGSQEVVENWNVLGISNFDQGIRVANTYLAELQRGNENQDTRGTRLFDIELTVRAAHLRVGQIVLLQYQQLALRPLNSLQSPPGNNISGILCRIQKIQPTQNFEHCVLTLSWHEDLWYTWAYGQSAPPLNSNPNNSIPNRAPYPWQPYGIQPISGDSVYGLPSGYAPGSWWLFGLAQVYTIGAGGVWIAQVALNGAPPVTQLSTSGSGGTQPPIFGIQGTSASTGGTIPGGKTFYFAIAAVDHNGFQSALSKVFTVTTPTGSNTCTITTPPISWFAGSVGFVLYGGPDSNNLSAQMSNPLQTPTNITITSLSYETWGPPDLVAESLHFQAKRVIHGGVWGDAVAAVSANTLTFDPFDPDGNPTTFTANQWVGYDIQLVAMPQGDTRSVPVANFRVSANDGNNLTVSPDPVGAGILPGSVFVMLIKPDPTSTASHIVEPNFINAYAPLGLTPNEGSNTLRILAGTGMTQTASISGNDATSYTLANPLPTTPDATSRPIIEEVQWTDELDTGHLVNSSAVTNFTWNFEVTNFKRQTVLIRVHVQDTAGNFSLEPMAPTRMLFLWGQGLNQRVVTDDTTILASDQVILCDTTNKSITVTLSPSAVTKGEVFIVQKISSDTNTVTVKTTGTETIDGATTQVITDQWGTVQVVSNG